jgi:hypothetical protein
MYRTHVAHHKLLPKPKPGISTDDAYGVPAKRESRHKDPQFKHQPPLRGQTTGFFQDAKDYFELPSEPYNGVPKLRDREKRQTEFGFGSKDVFKPDEFTNQTRQMQWKELLRTETKFQETWARDRALAAGDSLDDIMTAGESRSSARQKENMERSQRGLPTHFQTTVPEQLYDIGKDNGETPVCNKCSRETFYCKHRVGNNIINARRGGGSEYATSSQTVGSAVWGISTKPSHGRVRTTKSFYDISHLT